MASTTQSTRPSGTTPATTSPADLKTLEGVRTRLAQLANALHTLRNEVQYTLPSWQSLADTSSQVNTQAQSLATFLSSPEHARTLAAAHAYPLPSFPDLAHRGIVEQLLRKKPEPSVEDWAARGKAAGLAAGGTADATGQLRELWDWSVDRVLAQSDDVPWGIDYTIAERDEGVENVVTGLRRELDDGMEDVDDEDEEEGGDDGTKDKMVVDGGDATDKQKQAAPPQPAMPPLPPLEDLLRFMSNGTVSPVLAAAGSVR